MNAKISAFAICVETIIYLLLYNLHDCTFQPIPLTSCLLFRDASNEVCNVFILKHFNKEICSEKYEKYEKETSSTCSETCTCQFRLHFKKPICSSKDVLLNRLKLPWFKSISIIPVFAVFYQLAVQNHTCYRCF